MRVPWTAWRSNQSILKEINRESTGSTDAEAPILDATSCKEVIHWKRSFSLEKITGKDPDAGKDGGQEEKGSKEDEMVGWHQ